MYQWCRLQLSWRNIDCSYASHDNVTSSLKNIIPKMPATEIVTLTVKPDSSDIGDPANNGARVVKETAQTLSETDGCQRVHFGKALEDDQVIRLLIDWESLPKHREFMASSRYQPFTANMKPILQKPPSMFHVDFAPQEQFDKALSSPIIELAAFYFDGDVPSDYAGGVEQVMKLLPDVDGFKACAWGSTHEKSLEYNGVKGQAAVLAIGWTSYDAHMAFRETQTFKDNIHLLRNASKAAEMQHLKALRYHAD